MLQSNKIEVEVGRLLCGKIRDYLNKSIEAGMNITFIESKGVFTRHFTIDGDSEALHELNCSLNAMMS